MHFSRRKKTVQTKETEYYVTFKLGKEQYGIAINKINEVIPISSISRVPHSPEYMAGMMEIRGQIIPMIDLRFIIGIDSDSINPNPDRAVVITINEKNIGLIVDAVEKVIELSDNIDSAPPSIKGINANEILGVGKFKDKFIILLDIDRMLSKDEYSEVNGNAK